MRHESFIVRRNVRFRDVGCYGNSVVLLSDYGYFDVMSGGIPRFSNRYGLKRLPLYAF